VEGPALAQRPSGRRLAVIAPRLAIPALVVVAVALVAAADQLASSGPLGFAAAAALLLGAPALVAGLSRLSGRDREGGPRG
jgi:peptidoglycan/LPS O-acetylase OafA/YrhL